MPGPTKVQLEEWIVDLQNELSEVESEIAPLLERRDQLRRQINAIGLALPRNIDSRSSAQSTQANDVSPPQQPRDPRPRFTPVHAYWRPTLEALVELGGSAERDSVIRHVGERLNGILTEADKQMLPSGGQIRWENRVAFQRENMKRQGLIRGDSPRGIWEITEEGRNWLKDASERPSDSFGPGPNRNGSLQHNGGSRQYDDEEVARLLKLTPEQTKALRAVVDRMRP